MARIPRNTVARMGYAKMPYNIRGLLQAATTQQCLNCCEVYHHQHFCKAVTRICYTCRCYGHISASPLCPKKDQLASEQHLQPAASALPLSFTKEVQTDQHVLEQTTTDICSILPFSKVDEDEWKSTFVSNKDIDDIVQSAHQHKQQFHNISGECDRLRTKLKVLEKSEANLNDQVTQLSNKNKELTTKVTILADRVMMTNQCLLNRHYLSQSEIENLQQIITYLSLNGKTFRQSSEHVCNRCKLPTKHKLQDCPAFKNQCMKCRKVNHFAFACKHPLPEHLNDTLPYPTEELPILNEYGTWEAPCKK